MLRLLRPAEAAARRLVIMAARGLEVTPPRSRPRKPKPKQPPFRPGLVTGIWMPPHLRPQPSRPLLTPRACSLPLFDPLPRMRGAKRKRASAAPRLFVPGWSQPVPPERKPKAGPDDAIDAQRLALRLQALARALDDLPREAKRFARWRMRRDAAQTGNRDAAGARNGEARGEKRFRRIWPLKPGRPPGQARRPHHAVHEILSDTHALAIQSLERLDSS